MRTIYIILIAAMVMGGIILVNKYRDLAMDAYADVHNCNWSSYGAHDICK